MAINNLLHLMVKKNGFIKYHSF